MICGNKKDVSALFALLVYLLDRLVCLSYTLNSGLVDTSVANHIRRRKIVHQELKLALLDPLIQFLGHGHGTHLRLQIIGSHLG